MPVEPLKGSPYPIHSPVCPKSIVNMHQLKRLIWTGPPRPHESDENCAQRARHCAGEQNPLCLRARSCCVGFGHLSFRRHCLGNSEDWARLLGSTANSRQASRIEPAAAPHLPLQTACSPAKRIGSRPADLEPPTCSNRKRPIRNGLYNNELTASLMPATPSPRLLLIQTHFTCIIHSLYTRAKYEGWR